MSQGRGIPGRALWAKALRQEGESEDQELRFYPSSLEQACAESPQNRLAEKVHPRSLEAQAQEFELCSARQPTKPGSILLFLFPFCSGLSLLLQRKASVFNPILSSSPVPAIF